jgi:uncharacterized DUF497 family protein
VDIEFDPAKRQWTLAERGIDMAEAVLVFQGATITAKDVRRDYGEPRFLTIGRLRGRMVVIAWTQRGAACRVISMRKANEREEAAYRGRV